MRSAFIDSLIDMRAKNDRIMLLVADLGYSVIEPFADAYPESFINIGVAEQNMAGIAAGLASEGYIPFCYSIGNFNTFRCAEQIRNDISLHRKNIVLLGTSCGFDNADSGFTEKREGASPGRYAIMPALLALLRVSSASADVGIYLKFNVSNSARAASR